MGSDRPLPPRILAAVGLTVATAAVAVPQFDELARDCSSGTLTACHEQSPLPMDGPEPSEIRPVHGGDPGITGGLSGTDDDDTVIGRGTTLGPAPLGGPLFSGARA